MAEMYFSDEKDGILGLNGCLSLIHVLKLKTQYDSVKR
jgi:hypothetical protein